MLSYASALVALAALAQPILAADIPPGTTTFLSRPGQISVVLDVEINKDPKALSPGYVFTSPYAHPDLNFGVHIYDMNGDLVYCGAEIQEIRATDTHVCNFHGKDTICFTDGVPGNTGPGHAPGNDRFFDHTYRQVSHDFGAAGNLTKPDGHELNTPDNLHGKGMIVDVFQEVKYDLREYDGPKDGYIISGCFQQRRFKDDKVQFQWCSDEHIPFDYSYVYIEGNKAGNASNGDLGTVHRPWDYFHINAIDRDDHGDYYVSSRATHTIYKIGGVHDKNPGRVIWRLGGKFGDFKMLHGLNFSEQHDVRVQKMTKTETLLSIYDNHFPFTNGTERAEASSSKYILLNTKKMTAKLVQEYIQPASRFSPTGGAVQTLKNGNVFVGWGSLPSVSEHKEGNPGETLWYATFKRAYKSYRSYKYPWVGKPHLPPDVFAYQHKCNSKNTVVYMSWNGATHYRGWKVYGHNKNSSHGGEDLTAGLFGNGVVRKNGYETVAKIKTGKKLPKFIYVQALDGKGKVLGTSKPVEMFIPDRKLAKKCNEKRCPEGTNYGEHHSRTNRC